MHVENVEVTATIWDLKQDPVKTSQVVVFKVAGSPFFMERAFMIGQQAVSSGPCNPIVLGGEPFSVPEFIAWAVKNGKKEYTGRVSGTLSMVGARHAFFDGQSIVKQTGGEALVLRIDSLKILRHTPMQSNTA